MGSPRMRSIAAAVLATALTLVVPASAGAYTVSRAGYTGYTDVPVTYGHRSVAYGAQMFMPTRRICTANAYRERQAIQVTYRNWRWNGEDWEPYGYTPGGLKWAPTYTETWRLRNSCTNIPGNNSTGVAFLVADWDPTLIGGDGGYFSSDIVIKWYRSSSGAFLGRKIVNYDGFDFECDSPQGNYCFTGEGWVWLTGFTGNRTALPSTGPPPR